MIPDPTDIYSKSYKQAANIKDVVAMVTTALHDDIAALGAVIATLETTKEFGVDTRKDIMDVIVEARQHHNSFSTSLEQVLADIDIILRVVGETSGLTQQTKERLGWSVGQLGETGDLITDHVNTAADAATIAGGRQYLMLDGERLADVLELVEAGPREKALLKLDSAAFKRWETAIEAAAIHRKTLGKDKIIE